MQTIIDKFTSHKLITASNGNIGIDIAINKKPSLIILDMGLPGMKGDEVLKHLKNNDETKNIPVIVYTADANINKIKDINEKYKPTKYITKPADVIFLKNIINDILSD
jgi:response regulator RpfG family c-di-GMP phosphodiesterase